MVLVRLAHSKLVLGWAISPVNMPLNKLEPERATLLEQQALRLHKPTCPPTCRTWWTCSSRLHSVRRISPAKRVKLSLLRPVPSVEHGKGLPTLRLRQSSPVRNKVSKLKVCNRRSNRLSKLSSLVRGSGFKGWRVRSKVWVMFCKAGSSGCLVSIRLLQRNKQGLQVLGRRASCTVSVCRARVLACKALVWVSKVLDRRSVLGSLDCKARGWGFRVLVRPSMLVSSVFRGQVLVSKVPLKACKVRAWVCKVLVKRSTLDSSGFRVQVLGYKALDRACRVPVWACRVLVRHLVRGS